MEVVAAAAAFWSSLHGWNRDSFPVHAGSRTDSNQDTYNFMANVSAHEQSRKTFGAPSKSVASLSAVLQIMKGSQKKAYDAWLVPKLSAAIAMAYSWCRSSASEDGAGGAELLAAVADVDAHAVGFTVKEICEGLCASPPVPEILALQNFQQPEAQAEVAHSIALSSDHVKAGVILMKITMPKTKQQFVGIHLAANRADDSEDPLDGFNGLLASM